MYAVGYLAAVSLSPLHWDRYVVPIVPAIAILAAIALFEVVAAIGMAMAAFVSGPTMGRLTRASPPLAVTRSRTRDVIAMVTLLGAIMVLWPSAMTVAREDRLRALPSTRVEVTEWVKANLSPGVLVCEEMYTTYATPSVATYRIFALANEPLDAYRARGCRVLISSSAIASRFVDPRRYPREAAFYATLAADLRLAETFKPGPDRGGSEVRVYEWAP
jgi:hypothetical protein